MGEKGSVKLHGMWASPYTLRAQLGLLIKGIEYEYIEEGIINKSELLLEYNPIHKKVPVLVHNGHPIVESLIILEYIDETWTDPPHLLPKDPYSRAKHRFWAAYLPLVLKDLMLKALKTEGEVQQKTLKDLVEKLDVIEQGLKKEIFPNGAPSFRDDVSPGYLDIAFYSVFGPHEVYDEFFEGTKFLDPKRHPLLASWIAALSQVPVIKENAPSTAKLFALAKFARENALQTGQYKKLFIAP